MSKISYTGCSITILRTKDLSAVNISSLPFYLNNDNRVTPKKKIKLTMSLTNSIKSRIIAYIFVISTTQPLFSSDKYLNMVNEIFQGAHRKIFHFFFFGSLTNGAENKDKRCHTRKSWD